MHDRDLMRMLKQRATLWLVKVVIVVGADLSNPAATATIPTQDEWVPLHDPVLASSMFHDAAFKIIALYSVDSLVACHESEVGPRVAIYHRHKFLY